VTNRQDNMTISVIIGSTRQGRFSEKPAQWILQQLQKREGIEAQLLDLRDFPMPFFDQPIPPAMPGRPPYEHEVVKKWTAQIAASDGFVFVTPEYNYGPSAVLKNAIDWVYPEWNRKATAFVSYGSAMGARAVQQLRETAIEIQMAADSVVCSHSRDDALGTFLAGLSQILGGLGPAEGVRRPARQGLRFDPALSYS
jgi:NAD(P)H-dependent FMN reductase